MLFIGFLEHVLTQKDFARWFWMFFLGTTRRTFGPHLVDTFVDSAPKRNLHAKQIAAFFNVLLFAR